ncbi:DUF4296 domain-containing protein [Pedobacter cryoconitis]|uniref:DUF4296 domain-containing protein n=1 Tax=Pedobacter cryoconitis TaxID=188932 RepID=A0A7X0MGY8_9SPHI|nr:DUF4296 domain-containing protein [Pedobacter cryoconitis]MBB6498286.1 hypothetical protein [Pedobacter cryoconitis]
MRNFLCICLLLIGIGGCKQGIPSDIIQPDKMTDVLYNIHLTDGYIGTIPGQDSARRVSASFYKGVYQKFNIDSLSYTRSMNYYYDHPDVLSTIYTKITDRLKKSKTIEDKAQEKRLKKLAAIRKAKRDSMEKADPMLVKREAAAKRDSVAKAEAQLKKDRAANAIKNRKDSLIRVAQMKKAQKAEEKRLKENGKKPEPAKKELL